MNLFIFSEDLRLRDNKALYQASLEQKGLIALYIINKGKNEEHGDSLAKLKLKLLALAEIRNPLVSLNIPIKILHSQDIKDEPKEILGFCKKYQIKNIFLNSEYPFNEAQRNKKLETLCDENEINLKTKHPEFLEWKWINHENITDKVVEFKLHVYEKIKNELNKLILT